MAGSLRGGCRDVSKRKLPKLACHGQVFQNAQGFFGCKPSDIRQSKSNKRHKRRNRERCSNITQHSIKHKDTPKCDFSQGNIAKYVLRHQYKNGAEDLKKAIHYCDIAIAFGYNTTTANHLFYVEPIVKMFCTENGIKSDAIRYILLAIGNKNYETLKNHIAELLRVTY